MISIESQLLSVLRKYTWWNMLDQDEQAKVLREMVKAVEELM
jgi:hypothetical protein